MTTDRPRRSAEEVCRPSFAGDEERTEDGGGRDAEDHADRWPADRLRDVHEDRTLQTGTLASTSSTRQTIHAGAQGTSF